ncbi:MAG: phage tail tip lysozyme [Candidatus Nanopelagicaceae bacterium]
MQNFFTVALPLLATVTTSTASLPFVNYKMQGPPPPVPGQAPFSIIKEFELVDEKKTAIREVALPKPKEKRLICKGCNEYESVALEFFQQRGIKDRNALATIMGNIKQESTFIPNICEGGSRTSYRGCWRGYGLIQWTSANRYYGLGDFAKRYGGDPSSLHTQLRYLTNEVQWKDIEEKMKTPGKSINRYMDYAYSWIGWGHHGARTSYAHDYASRLILVEV